LEKLGTVIKIGTRSSQLALWQAHWVAERLKNAGLETEIVPIETTGDKILHKTIAKLGSKGVFTDELENQLRSGDIHIAVHSAKDLQSDISADLQILAFTERESVHDVLVSFNKYFTFDTSQRVVLGTSSTRRVAMIRHYLPKVKIVDMRGNLQTRFRKLSEGVCDALVLAYAGVHRLGFSNHIVKHLPIDTFTPAVGQGCLAIECAAELSSDLKEQIRQQLNHTDTEWQLLAERAFLKKLQGGCSVPVFGLATIHKEELHIQGGVISLNGKDFVRTEISGEKMQALDLGEQLAQQVSEAGGEAILQEIRSKLNSSRNTE
jgi:hydroxymethylbilane synthase